jgi:hypothetical protein
MTIGKRIRHLVGDSALLRYLQINLRFDPARLLDWHWSPPGKSASHLPAQPAKRSRER